MKYSIAVVLIFALLLCVACTQPKSTISGTISFSYDVPSTDTLYVGLYNLSTQNYVGDTLQSAICGLDNPEFSLKVEPGMYTLSASTFHSQAYRTHLFIPAKETHVTCNINLPAYSTFEQIDSVKIKGGFNEWNEETAPHLTKRGDVWVLQNFAVPEGDYYDFIINGKTFYDLKNQNINWVQNYATFTSIYHGGEIIFDPALYAQPEQEATASVQGLDKQEEFAKLVIDLRNFQDSIYDPMRVPGPRDSAFIFENYAKYNAKVDSLQKSVDPYFADWVGESHILVLTVYNPVYYYARKFRQEQADSLTQVQYYTSDEFAEFFAKNKQLVESYNPDTILSDGLAIELATVMQNILDIHPVIAEKFSIAPTYFTDFLLEKEAKTKNAKVGSEILCSIAQQNYYSGNQDLAITCLQKLIEKYPSSRYVNDNYAANMLKGLKMTVGVKAPEFAVQTTTGDSLKLADLAGKYVFIDFWGSWCGPCRGEIPNIKKLHAEMGGDKLAVIGLVKDTESALLAYLAHENITYANAMADDSLLNAYGIRGFPTTFLINPEGVIIAKDLRGDKLLELVQAKIQENEKVKG